MVQWFKPSYAEICLGRAAVEHSRPPDRNRKMLEIQPPILGRGGWPRLFVGLMIPPMAPRTAVEPLNLTSAGSEIGDGRVPSSCVGEARLVPNPETSEPKLKYGGTPPPSPTSQPRLCPFHPKPIINHPDQRHGSHNAAHLPAHRFWRHRAHPAVSSSTPTHLLRNPQATPY
jgi:hypothetical protein